MAEFTHCPSFCIDAVLSDEQKQLLKQFGIAHTLQVAQYSFPQRFEPDDPIPFVNALFSSEEVQATFLLPDISGKRTRFFKGRQQAEFTDVLVTATHTKHMMPAISERYMNAETFKGMAPEHLPALDMEIQYLVDSALFDSRTEDYKTFGPEWRDQLLNQLFVVLRAGGALNQQSEKVADYIELAVALYKAMVKPCRLEAEELPTLRHIRAYSVANLSGFELFPANPDLDKHPGNKCFVIVDGLRRFVYLLYNAVWL